MIIPTLDSDGLWLGRVERAGIGPSIVTLRQGRVVDITSATAPTARDVLERDDAADYLRAAKGEDVGPLEADHRWLAPCDLQAVKACGVTFAGSMVERVIEEQTAGDPAKADAIRARIGDRMATACPTSCRGQRQPRKSKRHWSPRASGARILRSALAPMPKFSPRHRSCPRLGSARISGFTRFQPGTTLNPKWFWP